MSSKFVMKQSVDVPQMTQVTLAVKAENTYDLINNVLLLVSLAGTTPQASLLNAKKGTLLPHTTLSGLRMLEMLGVVLPTILKRVADKVAASVVGSASNQFTFIFKASDAIPATARKLWKLLEAEVGAFNIEITFCTTAHNATLNETLLRSYQIPVVLSE